jgi:hypothetical protein
MVLKWARRRSAFEEQTEAGVAGTSCARGAEWQKDKSRILEDGIVL